MMSRRSVVAVCIALLASSVASAAPAPGQWRAVAKVPGIVDVVGPRADGRLVLSTHGGLFVMRPTGSPVPYARGPQGYAGSPGEAYLALGSGHRVPGAGCAFRRDVIFALDPDATPGIVRVGRNGRSSRFADLPAGAFPSGITIDTVGLLRLSPARHLVRSGHDDAHRVRLPRPCPCRGNRCSACRGRDRRGAPYLRPLRRQAHRSRRGDGPDLRLWPQRSRSPRSRVGTSRRRGHRGRVSRLRTAEARSPRCRVPRGYGSPGLADERVGQPADPHGHEISRARTCTRAS